MRTAQSAPPPSFATLPTPAAWRGPPPPFLPPFSPPLTTPAIAAAVPPPPAAPPPARWPPLPPRQRPNSPPAHRAGWRGTCRGQGRPRVRPGGRRGSKPRSGCGRRARAGRGWHREGSAAGADGVSCAGRWGQAWSAVSLGESLGASSDGRAKVDVRGVGSAFLLVREESLFRLLSANMMGRRTVAVDLAPLLELSACCNCSCQQRLR
jgi:hypothetical protein